MKLPIYSEAALNCDLAEQGLRRGDVVKLVDELNAPDGTPSYAVEVLNALGDTVKVTALPGWALQALRVDEILCVRPVG